MLHIVLINIMQSLKFSEQNMKKILLISGSARNGNCKAILENIQKNFWLEYSTDLVYIRDYNIKECYGCNKCAEDNHLCASDDRMDELLDKLNDADIVVLATPNYFYNVSGLTKLFLDRTYPFYSTKALKGKKFVYVYVGDGDTATTKKYLDNALYGFTVCHELSVIGSYAYQASDIGEFADLSQAKATTDTIVSAIRKTIEN